MRWTTENFILKSKEIHGDKFDYSYTVYVNAKTKVRLICKDCGYDTEVFAHNHLKGSSCKRCVYKRLPQNNSTMSHEDFVNRSNDLYGDKFEILGVFVNTKAKIQLRCNDCGYVFNRRPSSHLEKYYGCKMCVTKTLPQNIPKTLDLFVEQATNTHNDMYDYSMTKYTNCRTKVDIHCNTCGSNFMQDPTKHISGYGCPVCSFSKGELAVKQFLEDYCIKYEWEYKFDDCVNPDTGYKLRFDFYLPELNILIEYDGEHHYHEIGAWGGADRLEYHVNLDKIKNNYALDNSIKMIRIPYWEFENINILLSEEVL